MGMKVMMIGFSGSGKTTYMGGMYALLNVEPCEGFSLRAKKTTDHANFMKIGSNIVDGIYPKGTDILEDYRFSLVYDDDELLDFDWHDYRGGVLASADSPDFDVVVDQIMDSDALIVFLDLTMFAQGKTAERRCVSTLQRIMSLVQNVTAQLPDDAGFPISFVFTKLDCCPDGATETPGWKLFQQIIETISEGKQINGMWTATVAGSDGLLNLQYPFLFSMLKALNKKVAETIASYERAVERHNSYAEDSGLFDEIGTALSNFFNDRHDLSNYDKAVREEAEAKRLFDKAKRLADGPLEKVAQYLVNEAKKKDTVFNMF